MLLVLKGKNRKIGKVQNTDRGPSLSALSLFTVATATPLPPPCRRVPLTSVDAGPPCRSGGQDDAVLPAPPHPPLSFLPISRIESHPNSPLCPPRCRHRHRRFRRNWSSPGQADGASSFPISSSPSWCPESRREIGRASCRERVYVLV